MIYIYCYNNTRPAAMRPSNPAAGTAFGDPGPEVKVAISALLVVLPAKAGPPLLPAGAGVTVVPAPEATGLPGGGGAAGGV